MSGEGTSQSSQKPDIGLRLGLLPRVLLAQILALVLVVGLGIVAKPYGGLPVWGIAIAQGLLAAGASRLFRLSGWWLGAQFVLPVLAWGGLVINLPSWVYLVAFVGLFVVYSNASSERVPLYLTNRMTWAALSELLKTEERNLPEDSAPVFIDLGCGVGGTLSYLARSHPNWKIIGVENAPGPYVVSKLRSLRYPNVEIHFKSLWGADFRKVHIAYAFLSPAPMPRLIKAAQQEMTSGTLLISNSFWAPDMPYDGEIEVNDGRQTRLFFKRID